MTDPADHTRPDDWSDDRSDAEDVDDALEPRESDVRRAREIYEEVAAENPDPITRREAVEGELEDEGLSEPGGAIGEHNE
jgi:hypothetical protein